VKHENFSLLKSLPTSSIILKKLDMPVSRIGRMHLPILESGIVVLRNYFEELDGDEEAKKLSSLWSRGEKKTYSALP